jgi:hypothetical protein
MLKQSETMPTSVVLFYEHYITVLYTVYYVLLGWADFVAFQFSTVNHAVLGGDLLYYLKNIFKMADPLESTAEVMTLGPFTW